MLDGSPGFTNQVFEFLKEKVEKNANPLVVSLIADEMALMSQLTFDGEKYIGGVNKGEFGLNDDIATDSLVFMVVGVNCHFKLPVGYFLIKNMAAEERANLVETCLQKLKDCGVLVTSVTFDGPPVNQSLFKKLGGNLNADELHTQLRSV